MPKPLRTRRTGFTLLEILIATGIFMVVMVLAIGIFTLTISGSSGSEQLRINAQSARFAFESMTRDVRLAKGLVYTDPAANVPQMLIPPFEIQVAGAVDCLNFQANQTKLLVYQAKAVSKTADGKNQYTITRRTYQINGSKQLVLSTHELYSGASAKTAAEIKAIIDAIIPPLPPASVLDGLGWTSVTAEQNVLPTNFLADQFRTVCYQAYPAPGSATDTLATQPFLELDLTVLNERYNQTKEPQKQVKTTLRTMIVPRNFSSPLEVVQPGVQGGGQ